jgi:hypothetical protein
MQSKPWWLAMMAAVLLLSGTAAWADGDFYVVGNGSVGTKITYVPYIIEQPGFYFLTGNLTYSGTGNAITVNTDNVTLDLMGFKLTGPGYYAGANFHGIYISGHTNVEVRNGSLWGFAYAVHEDSANGKQHRIINIRVAKGGSPLDNLNGIILSGQNHLIKDCSSMNNWDGIGLDSGLISDCVATNNARLGIWINGPGSVLGSIACNNSFANFSFGKGTGIENTTSILVDRNSAYGGGTNYRNNAPTGSVVITANNAGTP